MQLLVTIVFQTHVSFNYLNEFQQDIFRLVNPHKLFHLILLFKFLESYFFTHVNVKDVWSMMSLKIYHDIQKKSKLIFFLGRVQCTLGENLEWKKCSPKTKWWMWNCDRFLKDFVNDDWLSNALLTVNLICPHFIKAYYTTDFLLMKLIQRWNAMRSTITSSFQKFD